MHWKSLPLRLFLYALATPVGGVVCGFGWMLAPFASRWTRHAAAQQLLEEASSERFWFGFYAGMVLTLIAMVSVDAHVRHHFHEHGDGDWRNR